MSDATHLVGLSAAGHPLLIYGTQADAERAFSAIAEKDAEIARLRADLSDAASDIQHVRSQRDDFDAEIERLKNELAREQGQTRSLCVCEECGGVREEVQS